MWVSANHQVTLSLIIIQGLTSMHLRVITDGGLGSMGTGTTWASSQFIPMKGTFCVPVCYMDSCEHFLISQKSFGPYHQVCPSPYWTFGWFNIWIGHCFGFHGIDRGANREFPNTTFFQCIINYSLLITQKELVVHFHATLLQQFFLAIKNVITCDVSGAMWFFSHLTVHHKTHY